MAIARFCCSATRPITQRFGFSAEKTGELQLPGAFERERLLGLEFEAGALDGAWGMIVPTGASLPKPKAVRAPKALRAAAAVARRDHAEEPCHRARGPRPRFRNTVTTIMLVLMTVLIVRDILVRRWGSPPPAPDVTQP